MNFFRSLFGTCCGTYVFSELRKNSWGRAFRHLLLLCFFCSIAIGIGNYLLIKYRWRAAYNSYNEIFGTRINFSENGIVPEKDPGISRRQEFPYNTLLIYVSSEKGAEEYPAETLRDRNVIVYWSQACVAIFARQHDLWSMMEITPDAKSVANDKKTLTFEELEGEIKRLSELPASSKWVFPEEYKNGLSSSQMFQMVRIGIVIGKSLMFFIGGLLMVLFITLFFSIVYRAFSANNPKRFAFWELWKIAIYTAFPVILVVSAFPVLQLPLTGYCHYMFIIGWSVYLFFVLRFLAMHQDEDTDKNSAGEVNE